MKKDIQTEEDLVLLVDTFYNRAFEDGMLAPHFEGMDFDAHKPQMVHFWAFVLLNKAGYTTNVFDKHIHLKVGKAHFAQWLKIFNETVDDLFEGEKANDAKLRATTLAWTFGEKMEKLNASHGS
jgi:hemoglobin